MSSVEHPLPPVVSDLNHLNPSIVIKSNGENLTYVDDNDVREPLYVSENRDYDEDEDAANAGGMQRIVRHSWFMLRKQMSEEDIGAKEKLYEKTVAQNLPSTEEQSLEDEQALEEEREDNACGLGSCRPGWMQRFLSKKTYVLVYGITGMSYFALSAYSTATLTTLEKRFKIPSRTTGLISCAWDIGVLVSVIAMGYFGTRGHKPRIVAMGSLLVCASAFIRVLPHLLYGPGKDALQLTKEYGGSSVVIGNISVETSRVSAMCGYESEEEECSDTGDVSPVPSTILVLASVLQGIGCSVYWTLGLTYLDDNTTKDKAPMLHATSQCLRLLGPTIGYMLASYTLSLYVDPYLTPRIDNSDPRWIGAWWLGWPPLGTLVAMLSILMALFPKRLPRAALRRADRIRRNIMDAPPLSRNCYKAFKHLLRNKILMYNTLSAVCFIFGNTGYWIFMPKYMETMYQQTSSEASLISGSIGLASAALGLVASGIVMSRYKPRPRFVTGWNVIIEFLDVICKLGWVFLDCGDRLLQGSWESNGTWNMTSDCNADCQCGPNVKYTPVCSVGGDASFYSPCHAGCTTSTEFLNGTTMFMNCSCVSGGMAVEGPCVKGCVTNFTIFLATSCILSFLTASGRAGNVLIQFRCVHEDDKPLALAFSEFLMCGLAFIPAPIIFGVLLDTTCLVWGETCGKSGNCWLYDDQKLRYLMNFTGSTLGVGGMLLDVAVCYYSKDLKIYDEDEEKSVIEANGRPLEAVS